MQDLPPIPASYSSVNGASNCEAAAYPFGYVGSRKSCSWCRLVGETYIAVGYYEHYVMH
jgi:hypothetical protein